MVLFGNLIKLISKDTFVIIVTGNGKKEVFKGLKSEFESKCKYNINLNFDTIEKIKLLGDMLYIQLSDAKEV